MTRRRAENAFTLLEVIIAIVILSSALVILLGMQSSAVDQTIRDRQEIQAMMLARRILAQYEIAAETRGADPMLGVGTREGSGLQLLKDLDVLEGAPVMTQDQQFWLSNLQVAQEISYWSIPNVDAQAMKRVFLRIWPQDTPDNVFEVVYYFSNEEDQKDDG